MKQLLTAVLTVLAVSGPVGPATPEELPALKVQAATKAVATKTGPIMIGARSQHTMLEAIASDRQRLRASAVAKRKAVQRLERAVERLRSHVGITSYVFSGSTPSGWDCSGLVRWTYMQAGIELEHSATKQANAGQIVEQPLPGDIVAYQHRKGDYYYHTGIYVGDGMTIQALNNTKRTMLVAADSPIVGRDKPVYIRVLDRSGLTAANLPAN